jgi:drug/metabolite transporter (DMT)-like permease
LLWAAIGVSLIGLALLTGTGQSPLALGDLLTLGAAVSFAVQIVLLGRFAGDHDCVGLTIVQLASATMVFLAAWPFTESFSWPGGKTWFDLVLTGVIATAAGFTIQTLAQKQLSATRAAIIFTLESVFAMFFGYLLAGDRLTGVQLIGAVLMIAAVGFAEIGPACLARRR